MTVAPVPAHWIRANHLSRVPRRHVIIDCEAHQTEVGTRKVQTFRLACAAFDYQSKAGRPWQSRPPARFADPRSLWEWVDECTIKGRRTIVVAHNLAYDLRIADAFTILPELGYELEMVRLDHGSAWCQWRRGTRALMMTDTVSWFGVGLDKIAALMRTCKVPLPDFAASDDEWFARCEHDVEILRTAWRRVIDWLDVDELGNWKPTGAGQGWAFLRHKHLTHKILHHGIERIAKVEREAAWTGRCEAWRWGKLPAGRWQEWDFRSAYAQVAEDCDVPTRLQGHLGPKSATAACVAADGFAALVHATVTTDTPTCPTRGNGGILWPVGTYTSWLWDHEARMAVEAGATVTADNGYRYEVAPALRSWATAILDMLADHGDQLDPLLQLVVKGWSRTTVGRFGAQWGGWDDVGEAHGEDCTLVQAVDGTTGRSSRLMMVGGRCLAEGDKVDAPDGAVHVMSWIMAECRRRLWIAMLAAGRENVAYVDTDGLFVNAAGSKLLAAAKLPGLRAKSAWGNVEVLGPRQLVLGGKLRVAGVPSSAVRVGPRTWTADVWRSLPASLRSGESDRVVLNGRTFSLKGVDRRRAHLVGGATAALDLDLL